jgi:hypothetical protein
MSRRRLVLGGLGLGLVASQAGHMLVYAVVYGPVAAHVQSTGAHAYFPALVKTAFGLTAAFMLLALAAVGLARMLAGRRVPSIPAPGFGRLLAMLFCLQLACFMVQESIETAAGAPATSAAALLLWGSLGQLPVAALAALALRWIAVRVGPAVASLLQPIAGAVRLTHYVVAVPAVPFAVQTAAPLATLSLTLTRRGPPL